MKNNLLKYDIIIHFYYIYYEDTGRSCRQYCPSIYQPICGSDGKTYANKCMLEVENCLYKNNAAILHYGRCNRKGNETLMI